MGNVSKKEVVKSESGVTLLILVITVIIMLILAGATIINITGKEGIVTETRSAVKQSDEKSVVDDVQIAVSKLAIQWNGENTLQRYIINKIRAKGEEGYKTENEGTIKIDRAGVITYYDKSNNEFVFDDEGTKKLQLGEDGKVGVVVADGRDIDNLQVGDTVTYAPSGTYIWQAEYATSYASTDTENYVDKYLQTLGTGDTLQSGYQDMSVTSWHVLSINESTGKVELVPAVINSNTVPLHGAQGYNNAVNLLDEACEALFGMPSKGISARSIDMDDIEGLLKEVADADPSNTKWADSKAEYSYGVQRGSAYSTTYSKYPLIYENEKLSVLGILENTTGLGLSGKPSSKIERNTGTSKIGAIDGTDSKRIKPTQTYYRIINTSLPIALGKYSSLILPKNGTKFWVASHSINVGSNYCNFHVRCVYGNALYFQPVFSSNGSESVGNNPLFPVVTIDFNKISGNSTDGWSVN